MSSLCLLSACQSTMQSPMVYQLVDSQGIPVANASIEIAGNKHLSHSDLDGYFTLPIVNSNNQSIAIKAAGFDQLKLNPNHLGQKTIIVKSPSDQQTIKRQKVPFDLDWRFNFADGDFAATDYTDSNWRQLNLPHDYSLEQDFDYSLSRHQGYLPGGTAWYRKTFELDAEDKNKQIQIQFDGIYLDATIYINGQKIGQQREGYTSKYFDLTPYLNFGKKNVIAVRVNNDVSKGPNSRWYTGSGIYRHVWLLKTAKTRVKNWGTFVTTPVANSEQAQVNIKTEVLSEHQQQQNLVLKTQIKTSDGSLVAETQSPFNLNDQQNTISQTLNVIKPDLWSTDSPTMYYAHSQILSGGQLIDDYITPFGIRTINFSHEQGFTLNGVPTKIKGVCVHHDGGLAVGAAVPDAVWERRLRKLKEIGVNAIRTAHNPMAPEYMDMLDRMGFLVMHEFADKWQAPYNPFHEQDWQQDFASTIAQHRNHPSVIIYSVGNEHGDPAEAEVQNHLASLANHVRSLDNTRPVTSALERGPDRDFDKKFEGLVEAGKHQDVFGMNYGEQWYETLEDKNPNLVLIGTESYRYFMSRETKRMAFDEHNQWLYYLNKPNYTGSFIWAGISYMGEADISTDLGLLDTTGFKTPSAHFYKSMWSAKPTVELAVYQQDPDKLAPTTTKAQRTGTDKFPQWGFPKLTESWSHAGKQYVDLVTYANTEEVELYVNGELIGKQKMLDVPNRIMKWRDVPWQSGEVKAVGLSGGKVVTTDTIKTALPAYQIELKLDEKHIKADQQDVAQVEVYITDKHGNWISDASHLLNFEVSGAGTIRGVSNGNGSSKSQQIQLPVYEKNKEYAFEGRALAVIQAKDRSGEIKLTVSAEGLKPASTVIYSH